MELACEIHLSLALAEAKLGHRDEALAPLDEGEHYLHALPEDASGRGYLERLRDEATAELASD